MPIPQAIETGRSDGEATISTEASTIERPTSPVAEPNERVGARQSIEPATAHVRGRLILPPGMPSDVPVQLVAHAFRGTHGATTIAFADDGTFDVIMPSAWYALRLEVRPSALRCQDWTWFPLDAGDQTVELRPALTSRLEVRFLLPQGVTDEEIAQAKGMVSVDDGESGISGLDSRTLCPAKSTTVRFDSLPVGGDVTVRARIAPFPPCTPGKALLVPGECTRIEMQLERGARVSGLVVTDTGQPVVGAEVSSPFGFVGGPDGGPWAKTDARGHFELSGLPSGDQSLMVMKNYGTESHSVGWLNVSSLMAGGMSEGLRIVVKP
jgi:hypothetical protein